MSREEKIPQPKADELKLEPDSSSPIDKSKSERDPMGPPEVPCECWCMHCNRIFMSDQIWFQRVVGDPSGFEGFWMCPTPNCGGAGYTFDIFPTDPSHPDNAGWSYDDDDEEEYDEFDDEEEAEARLESILENAEPPEYDPSESKYQELDTSMGAGEEDFIEGDEWKLGLAPGEEVPPQAYWPEAQRREWEEEQKKYDGPDLRPRELDWSDRTDREDTVRDEDIPF